MLITDIRKYNNKKSIIIGDGKPLFSLYNSEIYKFNICINEELEDDVINMIKNDVLSKRCLERTFFVLKQRDKTVKEMKELLEKAYYPNDIISNTIEFLITKNFLNDERYAKQYISYQSGKLSKKMLITKLTNKGIDSNIINFILEDTGEVTKDKEIDKAYDFLIKKYSTKISDSRQDKAKIMNALARKGFDYDIITQAVRKFYKNDINMHEIFIENDKC